VKIKEHFVAEEKGWY